MPKTQSRSLSSTGKQEPPSPLEYVNFKIGDRATVKLNHPIFPGVNCTITAFPSPDAAIVELDSGLRERLLLKYLEPLLEQNQEPNNNSSIPSYLEAVISDNPTKQLPSNDWGGILVEVEEALTPDEERERHRLELKVERAFYEAGFGLRELRDKRLYRSTHQTFEEYCIDRFGYTRRNTNYMIAAAAVVENLGTNGSQNDENKNLATKSSQVLPTSERQVRPLVSLAPVEQRLAWQQAVDLADGKVPSGRIVKGVVERLKEKPLNFASSYCSVGEIFKLQRLMDDDQKYNGWWGIALEVENRLSVKCQVYDRTIEIRQENIKRIDMDKQQLVHQQAIIERVSRLARCNLDPAVWALLQVLNQQTYHTSVQIKLLETAEQLYGIYDYKN